MSYDTDYEYAYKNYIAQPNWRDVVENVDYDLLAATLAAIYKMYPPEQNHWAGDTVFAVLEEAAHVHAERVAERLDREREDIASYQWLQNRRPG